MGKHYSWWMMLPHADFARIVDPSDQVFMLLATHCKPAHNHIPTSSESRKENGPGPDHSGKVRTTRTDAVFSFSFPRPRDRSQADHGAHHGRGADGFAAEAERGARRRGGDGKVAEVAERAGRSGVQAAQSVADVGGGATARGPGLLWEAGEACCDRERAGLIPKWI